MAKGNWMLIDGAARNIKKELTVDMIQAKYPHFQVEKIGSPPSMARMERWMNDGGAETTDGCWVEPDGHCEHGHPSWVLALGYI